MDCGEGTQQKLRQNRIRMQRISHIFISHLHGDHYLGLMGLVSSYNLLGREKTLTIVGPSRLQEMIEMHLDMSASKLQFPVEYVVTDHTKVEKVVELDNIEVIAFPLTHKIPTTGFLFREHSLKRKIDKQAADAHGAGVKDMNKLVMGEDLVKEDGTVVPNAQLTFNPPKARSFAYCSDTAYKPEIVDVIKEVDLLYHEATFIEEDRERAKKTTHSTARQAATIAKEADVSQLIIGHYSARYTELDELHQQAMAVFEKTELAKEGSVFEV